MKLFKKYWIYFAAFGILALYFITRMTNIVSLPIFTDEAIYIRWSQIAKDDAMWRFISLTDGKQPMFVWIGMLLLSVIQDPVLAGRLVSVFAGFFSLMGIFLLGRELFKNSAIGLLASLLYVIYPFALMYDRLALYDSLVSMFIIWAYFFTILLVRYVRLDLALILGMIIGGGLLTKTNTSFSLILLPFSLLLFPFKPKFDKNKLGKWILFALTSLIIAVGMYTILRLSPFYHIIGEKNLTFIYSFNEWIQNPFAYVFGNLKGLLGWFIDYITLPFIILAISGFFLSRKFTKEKLLLLIWFLVPFMALAFFGKVIYPRFILFMTIPFLLLGAYSLNLLMGAYKVKVFKALIFLVFTLMFLITDYFILTNPVKASIPNADREQFITGWPAGGGVTQTISFLEEKAKKEKIYVGTQGTFGLMPYALEMYLGHNPNIIISGFWPVNDIPPNDLIKFSKIMPVYVVFYQPCVPCAGIGKAPSSWKVTEIFQIKKAQDTFYTLYKMDPQ